MEKEGKVASQVLPPIVTPSPWRNTHFHDGLKIQSPSSSERVLSVPDQLESKLFIYPYLLFFFHCIFWNYDLGGKSPTKYVELVFTLEEHVLKVTW